ncbi:5'/3'-nucleotidase SurE [Sporosalibacterium faouarense]|uniref:5'/3'-nucleotidase SurE n=1 Tax=Sporosalibacterium faouarense TaxID=516123 RepID=UPI00141C021B|nr:5'/3'-nucleotidase SurE [Sporosalibacterium faouarense]MTI48155.1 5'/3'-nucleotidase SurE [Bacillota bacterium]
MRILITNDDGINAIGIRMLVNSLKKLGKITVVAPDRERSATGHAITMHHPLRIEKVQYEDPNVEAWSINGTPSDCVKIAVESILEEKPDIIVSGINNGANLGTDILYSGTVSAAIEGAIHNIPSIALSVYGKRGELIYEGASYYSCKLIEMAVNNKLPNNIVMNVNFPSLNSNDIKGIEFTELGIRRYQNSYEQRKDPMGKNYYWLSGSLIELKNNENSDVECVKNGYISVTPLHFDLTDYNYLKEMKNWVTEK